ncbi:Cell division control protein 73 [Escovopsis weberi]|uniref:Cell division control protein 73 n=1 Tax=Escovopsis weberi TaxID=150374 RepID=A0A0M9VXM6_ESCWE|nr:Cell division control protein 73 [Escovopsis weberi]
MAPADHDPLLLLRQSISADKPFVPSASADPSAPEVALSEASHLRFSGPPPLALPIDCATRFVSSDKPVDLRSIYFAWLNRELAIPEYNASSTTLNDALAASGSGARVQNLGFIERLDLITWLEGASEESDVYDGERRMGDRNSVLRGIKPTDFSHVRKLAIPFVQKKSTSSSAMGASQSLSINQKSPARRPDPIILLSPSASSLLRMSNARAFLEDGRFVPADAGASATSMLHVQRTIPGIDAARPMRFILVEGSEQFKPEYWNRVVAVFTTGQTWQFKNYKWSSPNDLFKHTLGVYVGWRDDVPPENIRGWGHRVLTTGVDRWRGEGDVGSRFRDKEVVEQIWKAIEGNMRSKGWRKDAAPTSI